MSHYDILRAIKTGYAPDHYTAVYAKCVGGGAKEYERYISGTPPLILSDSVGRPLVSWSITGNTVQDGEPTPTEPIEVKGTGDKTGNLVDIADHKGYINNMYYSEMRTNFIFEPNITYTISYDAESTAGEFRGSIARGGPSGAVRDILSSETKDGGHFTITFTTPSSEEMGVNNFFYIRFVRYGDRRTFNYSVSNIMLNEGSEPLPYEPYGYKVPVVTRGKNLCPPDILQEYIGFTDGVSSHNPNYSATDYFEMSFNDINDRVSFNGLPNDATSCIFVYDENHVFIGRTGNNTKVSLSVKPDVFANGSGTKEFDKIKYARMSVSKPNYKGTIMVHHWDVRDTPSEFQPYEPYIEPITTPIYLNSPLMADEVLDSEGKREVEWRKRVLTGDEKAENQSGRYDTESKSMFAIADFTLAKISMAHKTTHFRWYTSSQTQAAPAGTFAQNQTQGYARYFYFNISNDIIGVSTSSTSVEKQDAFKAWLKSEYDAGHPVTVWYQLATPTSETVDVPAIPTIKGNCTIDIDTEVKPSEMSVTYKSRR